MKPQLKLLLAVTTALGSALAGAQDARQSPPADPAGASPPTTAAPPEPGSTPAPPATPPPPNGSAQPPAPDQHPLGGHHRHDGPGAPGQPDGQRPQNEPRPGGDLRSERGPSFGERRERFQHPDGDRPEGHDGNRAPDGAARGEGPGREQRPQRSPLPPPKPMPYLGVVTSPVPPIVAAQLGLAEDFGLVVEGVLPESPAATAGLQRFDVLKLYNDQQIVDPHQLQILVKATGKDGSATLTVIRKGQEQKVSIKVGERVLPNLLGAAHRPGDAEHGPGHQGFDHQRFAEHRGPAAPGADHKDGNPPGPGAQGFNHQRFAEQHGENHGPATPGADRKDGDHQGPGHRGFDRQRFAQGGSPHRGPDQQRFSNNGFDHRGSGREGHRHHGFGQQGRHGGFGRHDSSSNDSDRQGFGHHHRGHHGFAQGDSEHRGFGHHGSGHHGFAKNGSGHRGFGHHGVGHDGFAGNGSEHRGFGHHGSGREGFARGGGEQKGSGHQGPGPQIPGRPGADHQQPSNRAGRQPGNRGPDQENRRHDFQIRPQGWQHRPSADAEQPSEQAPLEPANILREIRPGGAAQIRIVQPEGAVVYDTANAKVLFTDASGRIEIATKEGHRTLLATSAEGGTLFEGPINTADQVNSVPEDIRKKVDWIEARTATESVKAPAPVAPAGSQSASVILADANVL